MRGMHAKVRPLPLPPRLLELFPVLFGTNEAADLLFHRSQSATRCGCFLDGESGAPAVVQAQSRCAAS